MLAVWLENRQLCVRTDTPEPTGDGEVRVRVLRAGICNTDVELVRGYYPFRGVLGHEFVGVVDDPSSPFAGRRVVGEINAVCGRCRHCRNGRPSHCANRTVLGIVGRDGAFAEYLTLPAANLLPVPDEISTDAATFTEPLAAALQIQEQVSIAKDMRVVVVGDGKLGLLIAQTLAFTGCALTVVGRHRDKLAIVERRGIEGVTAADIETGAFDVAVECTGNADGFALARRALRPRGTLVLKSTYAGALEIDVSSIVVDEITLVGSRCGPFDKALELLRDGRVDVEAMIHGRYPLSEALAAFEHAQRPGALKVLLDINAEEGE